MLNILKNMNLMGNGERNRHVKCYRSVIFIIFRIIQFRNLRTLCVIDYATCHFPMRRCSPLIRLDKGGHVTTVEAVESGEYKGCPAGVRAVSHVPFERGDRPLDRAHTRLHQAEEPVAVQGLPDHAGPTAPTKLLREGSPVRPGHRRLHRLPQQARHQRQRQLHRGPPVPLRPARGSRPAADQEEEAQSRLDGRGDSSTQAGHLPAIQSGTEQEQPRG